MAVDMNAWSQSRGGAAPAPEEDVPEEEMNPGPPAKSEEELENLAMSVERHMPQIETQIQMMNPESLLAVETELPEEEADRILEMVDTWGDGFSELASGITEPDAIRLSEMVNDSVLEVEPILVGAWVFRAGQLA